MARRRARACSSARHEQNGYPIVCLRWATTTYIISIWYSFQRRRGAGGGDVQLV